MAEYIERDVLLKAVEKMDRLDKETKTKYEYNKFAKSCVIFFIKTKAGGESFRFFFC